MRAVAAVRTHNRLVGKGRHYPETELTYKTIGCAMEVHNVLGNGFQEVIYQRALDIEMKRRGLLFVREQSMNISHKGQQIGTRRVEFFVENG